MARVDDGRADPFKVRPMKIRMAVLALVGLIVRLGRVQPVMLTELLTGVAVKLLSPSEIVAPEGIATILLFVG